MGKNSNLDPSGAVFGGVFEELLVEFSASVEFSQLQLQIDVWAEQLVFGAFPNRDALRK